MHEDRTFRFKGTARPGEIFGPLPDEVLRAITDVLGATEDGLTGAEIGQLLASCRIQDPSPTSTKRYRLYDALSLQQRQDGAANGVLRFIAVAMNPVRFIHNADAFELRRSDLNAAMSFIGLCVAEDGTVRRGEPAKTLPEALARSRRLQDELRRRHVHGEVLRFCQAELLQQDCFDVVFEATKGLAERIREMTGLVSDGAELVDSAFALGPTGIPRIAFNTLRTPSEVSEQRGLAHLMKGAVGAFRNPAAHVPKIKWSITESDALDLLTLLSLVHRRLDSAAITSRMHAGIGAGAGS